MTRHETLLRVLSLPRRSEPTGGRRRVLNCQFSIREENGEYLLGIELGAHPTINNREALGEKRTDARLPGAKNIG